jgi:hypothetical protein
MLLHHVRGIARPGERLAAARELLSVSGHTTGRSATGPRLAEAGTRAPARRARQLPVPRVPGGNQRTAAVPAFRGTSGTTRPAVPRGCAIAHDVPIDARGGCRAALARFDELAAEEQYADFLRLRPFRRSLLCRGSESLTREIDLDALLSLPLYTDLAPDREGVFPQLRRPGLSAGYAAASCGGRRSDPGLSSRTAAGRGHPRGGAKEI